MCTDKISIKFRLSEDNVNLFTLLSARILVQASEKANLKREKTEKSYIRILIHPLAGRAIGNSQLTMDNSQFRSVARAESNLFELCLASKGS